MGKKSNLAKRGITAALLCLSMMICGCQSEKKEEKVSAVKVETKAAQAGNLEINTEYIGTLSPNLTVDVMPLVAGTVKKVYVKPGDKVKAGDLLAKLDDTAADLSVRTAEDAVASAKAGKEAAEKQADSAQIQAQSNVKTLAKTLEGYEKSLKTAKNQLKKLKASKKGIRKAEKTAGKAYALTKKRYKSAQQILIQFEVFLNDNPDCKTTPGLMAAGSGVSSNPGDYMGSDISGNTDPAGDQAAIDIAKEQEMQALVYKKKQAEALMAALQKTGLTVEYLSETGMKALQEDMEDGKTAYTSASSGMTQLQTSIGTMKTNIAQLEGQIEATKVNLNAARKLAALSSGGTDVYDAQIQAAETGVASAKYQKDLYRLTAPIDGIIDTANVKEEGMVTQGMPAFTLSEKQSMVVTFYVTQEVRDYLKIGDTVTLPEYTLDNNELLTGLITLVGNTVDAQKGLFKVEAEVSTKGVKNLAGGSSIKISVVSAAVEGGILVPYDAVYYEEGQAYVYKVVDDKAMRCDVETGMFNEDQITVTSGLHEGDSIVTTWASGLKDGAQVEVIREVEE